ncbi:MAG: hypothetical protein ABS79_03390 [Planctomycetes bacterium SCN 63-9]|nr:MAG: hypothetical protein ABS79_03390 [Planctomycetes bacterium SCN 63-9]
MAIQRGNQEDQDSSIKSRANEVFSDSDDSLPIRSFREYLDTTRATPLSFEVKGLLWVTGLIVAILFFGAILRVQLGPRRRPPRPSPRAGELPSPAQKQGSIRAAASFSPAPARMDPLNLESRRRMASFGLLSDQVPNSGRRVES